MGINRRVFLGLATGILTLGPGYCLATATGQRFLGCRSSTEGEHYASLFNQRGETLFDIPLPARGHGFCVNAKAGVAAVFARRPGDFVWIIDLQSGEIRNRLVAGDERHYYGHGVFTADGAFLLCSENLFESGKGVIGVYDANRGYQRVDEMASQGIGPHEIKLLNDQKTLVVANGGIRTHPDLPRVKMNLNEMRPNLAYLDIDNGHLIDKVEPPKQWRRLSIRHIDIAKDDRVAIAMQYEGKTDQRPPLIALHQRNHSLKLLSAPHGIQQSMRNYCGSVAFSRDSSRFAVSSPRGGLVSYWSAEGRYLGMHKQNDVCGVSRYGDGFITSDGSGRLLNIDGNLAISETLEVEKMRWDNHLTPVSSDRNPTRHN